MMRKDWVEVYIGLGSNLGDRAGFLKRALECLQSCPEIQDIRVSSIWETVPWGVDAPEEQNLYLNAAARFLTCLEPLELLGFLQQTEEKLERKRPYPWAPRTIDLDILLYGDAVIQIPQLTVPHPWMKQRLFVLLPLHELVPQLIFPDGERLEAVLQALAEQEGLQGIRRVGSMEELGKKEEESCNR